MDKELRSELEGLVCSFLQTNLKNFPTGMPLNYFERSFHEQAEEDHDWYKRFKTSSPLEALQTIPNIVNISGDRRVGIRLSMNKHSDKADPLLIELIEGQKSSVKRNRSNIGRSSSQRAMDSFSMNRRFSNSGSNYASVNRFERVTMKDQSRSSSRYNSSYNNYSNNRAYPSSNRGYSGTQEPSRYTQYNRQSTTSAPPAPAPADPRLRNSAQAIPSQARQPPTPQAAPTPAKQPSKSSSRPVTSSLPTFKPSSTSSSATQKSVPVKEDSIDTQRQYNASPALSELRQQVRQKLVRLLLKRTSEVKLLYLSYIYRDEYGEELDHEKCGYKSLLALLQDTSFSDQFQITYKGLDTSVSLRRVFSNGTPVAAQEGNAQGQSGGAINGPFADKTNLMTPIQKKYDASDAFNIRSMLHELGSLKAQEPILYNNKIEDIIIFRTARMILTSEGQTLKLEEWERKYQQAWNYNNRISINDYGCRTLLEFFKLMAQDIPMKIHLINDEWIAKSSKQEISSWIERKLNQGKYKVLIVADPKYDQVAYPGDTYPLLDISNLPQEEWFQAVILSVSNRRMWLQLRTVIRVRDHLQIETSLTCYQDHKKKNYFAVAPALIKVGFPCVAFDSVQNRWCRAMIIEIPEDTKLEANTLVLVFLVDYAIFRKLPISSLSCILKSHLRQPVGLIYAHLDNIEQGKVDLAARTLKEYTSPPVTLACKFLHNKPKPRDEVDIIWPAKKDIRLVCLKDTRQGNDIDLAEAINASTGTKPIEID